MMRKALLGVLLVTAMQAQAEYKCSVTPRDDVVLKPQHVQVVGETAIW